MLNWELRTLETSKLELHNTVLSNETWQVYMRNFIQVKDTTARFLESKVRDVSDGSNVYVAQIGLRYIIVTGNKIVPNNPLNKVLQLVQSHSSGEG